jgi:hypothetical protein
LQNKTPAPSSIPAPISYTAGSKRKRSCSEAQAEHPVKQSRRNPHRLKSLGNPQNDSKSEARPGFFLDLSWIDMRRPKSRKCKFLLLPQTTNFSLLLSMQALTHSARYAGRAQEFTTKLPHWRDDLLLPYTRRGNCGISRQYTRIRATCGI